MTLVKSMSMLVCMLASVLPTSAAAECPVAASAAARGPGKLFVVVYRPGPKWIPGRPMKQQDLRPHASYIAELTRAGRVFAGGGFVRRDGGLAIIRATDDGEARAMITADPAIVNGVFLADVHEWAPRFHTSEPLLPSP